jgi:hypothetical protein
MAITVGSLPQVLAGPIVRRVNKSNVAVWVALRNASSVTLEVIQPANPNATPPLPKISLSSTPVNTVQIGTALHVALVDFDFLSTPSNPATPYFYNLHFTGSVSGDLRTPGVVTAGTTPFSNDILSYPAAATLYPDQAGLPSFVLPQSALADVRLAQGSCRKTHANSVDALILLDDDIGSTFSQSGQPSQALPTSKRIQQLFFTGDQIYGDDVGDWTLSVIRDVAAALVGETFLTANIPALLTSPAIAVGQRQPFVIEKCGFTPDTRPDTSKSHLLLFGEFCAMHLVMWSPVLWPNPLTVPTFKSIYPDGVPESSLNIGFDEENAAIKSFVLTLPAARRVLANVATYMVLDDHDVTDDFYMNRQWLTQVLASEAGGTVIRNGLLAYALFQGWGNDPDNSAAHFAPLLTAVTNWATGSFSPSDTTNLSVISTALRIPTGVNIVAPFVFQADADNDPSAVTIDWHFFFKFDNYEIIALDTRTHRTYPIRSGAKIGDSGLIAPGLISADALNDQIPADPPTWLDPNGGVTIVVLPGPWTTLSFIEQKQLEATTKDDVFAKDVELLHFDAPTFDSLIARLAARDPNGGHIVVFCGDVHESYATAMQYWTSGLRNPLDPASATGATQAAIAQLVSSAIKNEGTPRKLASTIALHFGGFRGEQINTTRLGWLFPPGELPSPGQAVNPFNVGTAEAITDRAPITTKTVAWTIPVDPSNSTAVTELVLESKKYASVTPGATVAGGGTAPPSGPDWRLQRTLKPGQTTSPSVQKTNTGPSLGDFVSISGDYSAHYVPVKKGGQQIVGVNNIAVVSFSWGATQKTVTQDVFWFNASFDKLYAQQPTSGTLTGFVAQFKTKTSVPLSLDLPGPMPSGTITITS